MGYQTDMIGRFELDKPLTAELAEQINDFSGERHDEAGYPGIWCQWVPTDDNRGIEWDGNEKFYNYVEWLQYIIVHFLVPNGYVLNGEVEWAGEDRTDIGLIKVDNNIVTTKQGKVTYE